MYVHAAANTLEQMIFRSLRKTRPALISQLFCRISIKNAKMIFKTLSTITLWPKHVEVRYPNDRTFVVKYHFCYQVDIRRPTENMSSNHYIQYNVLVFLQWVAFCFDSAQHTEIKKAYEPLINYDKAMLKLIFHILLTSHDYLSLTKYRCWPGTRDLELLCWVLAACIRASHMKYCLVGISCLLFSHVLTLAPIVTREI